MEVSLSAEGRLLGVPAGAAEPDVRIAVDARLQALRALYDAGDAVAALEAVGIVGLSRRLPLGGGYEYRWPELPPDWADRETEAVVALWRGMRAAEAGAAQLRSAGSAADVALGLRMVVSGLIDAQRGGRILEGSRG